MTLYGPILSRLHSPRIASATETEIISIPPPFRSNHPFYGQTISPQCNLDCIFIQMKIRSISGIAGVFLMGMMLNSCIADLRPRAMPEIMDSEEAKELLEAACKKHGLTVWKEHKTYTVTLKDQFQGLKGWYANAFGENPVELQGTFAIGRFEGELEFLSGKKKGEIWGFMNGKTYRILPGGANITKENKNIRFWVPTIQYFIEFPLRILEADAVAYAGEESRNGEICDKIIVSWNSLEPNKHMDQYLIWINRNSGMIDLIQYTVRDYFSWYRGTTIFNGITNFEGVLIPTDMPVYAKHPDKGKVHHMRLENFRFLDSDDIPEAMDNTQRDSLNQLVHTAPVNTDPAAAFVEVSRSAIDRNCGSCHHSNRSTNQVALGIFDLANACWYCTISTEQIVGLRNRTQESKMFTAEEQEAIQQVIEKLK